MRQTLNPSASFAALARALLAATAGLAMLPAPTARAGENVIWNNTGTTAAWDTTSANWTGTGGTTKFTNGDSVVFGIDATGSATNQNARIDIVSPGVTVGPQPYGTGTNPGIIIGSGSWFFVGGTIAGGSMLITGTSAYQYTNSIYDATTGTGGGRLYIYDQRIDVADNADFKYSTSINQVLEHRGSGTKTVDGGAIRTGTNTNLTLEGTYGGIFFYSQTTSQRGGAIYTGGNLIVNQASTGTLNWFNFILENNSAQQQGGAIYSKGDITMASSSGTAAMLTPYFSNNKSGAEGGAIYTEGNLNIVASATFNSNTSASKGGAIYSKGDVNLGGRINFNDNSAATAGGAIYTEGNLTLGGTGSVITIAATRASGSQTHDSSIAYVGGTMTLGESTTLATYGGGISAQEFNFTNATIGFTETGTLANSGTLRLTTIDAAGNPVAAPGKINFDNTTIDAFLGELATNPGGAITISNTLTVYTTATALSGKNSKISANLAGDGEFLKTGATTLELTGTNTYTGPTTVAAGTLVGNITDSSTLNILAGALYRSGSNASRNIAELNGAGAIDMMGNTLNVASGNFATGTMVNTAIVNKITDGTFSISSGTVGNLNITDGKFIASGTDLHATGTTTILATSTLGVNMSDTTALYTGALDAQAGATIDITGYGNITKYTGSGVYTLIESTGSIAPTTYNLTTHGNPVGAALVNDDNFLSIKEIVTTATSIGVRTSLMWNNTDPASAHGTFNVNTGTFSLDTNLADNTAAPGGAGFGGWDGTTLLKKGAGTLILNGTNTYTGSTTITDGVLINQGVIGAGDIIIQSGTTRGVMVNHGVIGGNVRNAGIFVFESLVVSTTVSGSLVTTDTVAPAGVTTSSTNTDGSQTTIATTYSISTTGTTTYLTSTTITTNAANGKINGNIENTGTFNINLALGYTWGGTLAGNAGIIIKSGTGSFTHNGDNTYSGTLQIDNGTYASGKAHNLDSVAQYILTSTYATLDLGGRDQNLKNVMNNGIIKFGPAIAPNAGAAAYVTATIANYTSGTQGYAGTIAIRSDYNAGPSTGSGYADHIHFTGAVSGTHRVTITNADNITPDKTRPYIKFIEGPDVGRDNEDLLFTGTIDVGMGRIMVARGDGTLLSPDTDAWYLASGNHASNVADAILSTASVSGLEWHYQLDSVRQRMGDLRQEALMAPPEKRQSPLAYTTVTSKGGNAWLRASAYHLDADAQITTDAFSENVGGISFGYDKAYRWEDNQYLLGAYAVLSEVKRDFDTRGDGKTNSYGAGLYFSYLKDNGWYGDTTLLFTKNNNEFSTHPIDLPTEIINGDYSNMSWGVSLEIGKTIKHKKTGWWIEPSAQAEFAVINGKTYETTSTSDIIPTMQVKMADANVAQFRASIRVGRDIGGTPVKPYIRLAIATANTWGGRIRSGDLDDPVYYTADMDGSRLEAGAGLSYIVSKQSQVYLDYEYAKASDYQRPWAANVGYRWTW